MVTLARYNYLLYERKFPELSVSSSACRPKFPWRNKRADLEAYLLGTVYWVMNDEAQAKANYECAREQAEATVRESRRTGASRGSRFDLRRPRAERRSEGGRSARGRLIAESTDAFDGPILAISRARICVRCGDRDRRCPFIEHSLSRPAGVTMRELRLDPTWDPFRNDPRFQKLISQKAAETLTALACLTGANRD